MPTALLNGTNNLGPTKTARKSDVRVAWVVGASGRSWHARWADIIVHKHVAAFLE